MIYKEGKYYKFVCDCCQFEDKNKYIGHDTEILIIKGKEYNKF